MPVDNRTPERPIFFVTEDLSDGALCGVGVHGTGWNSLHQDVATSFLRISDDSRFEWTVDEDDAKDSAEDYYPDSGGISFHKGGGKLYFMSKVLKTMIILDLENLMYESETMVKSSMVKVRFLLNQIKAFLDHAADICTLLKTEEVLLGCMHVLVAPARTTQCFKGFLRSTTAMKLQVLL